MGQLQDIHRSAHSQPTRRTLRLPWLKLFAAVLLLYSCELRVAPERKLCARAPILQIRARETHLVAVLAWGFWGVLARKSRGGAPFWGDVAQNSSWLRRGFAQRALHRSRNGRLFQPLLWTQIAVRPRCGCDEPPCVLPIPRAPLPFSKMSASRSPPEHEDSCSDGMHTLRYG